MSCNTHRHNSCHCGTGCAKQMAAPTFMEDLYQFATNNNLFEGTIQEFLQFMRGPGGDDVYTWSVKNGFFSGTKTEFFLSLHGPGINIIGELNDPSELPATGNKLGDAYTIGRDLYIFSQGEDPNGPGSFVRVPDFKGPKGDKGDPGDGSELEDYYTKEEVNGLIVSLPNPDWNATNGHGLILNKPTNLSQFVNDLPNPDLTNYVRKNGINTVGDTNPFGLHTSGLEMELTQTDFRLIDRDLNNNQILIDPTQGSLTMLSRNDSKLELDKQHIRWFHADGGYSRLKQADAGFLSELKFPNSDRPVNIIPISVNGIFSDTSGNITIPTGGGDFVTKDTNNDLTEQWKLSLPNTSNSESRSLELKPMYSDGELQGYPQGFMFQEEGMETSDYQIFTALTIDSFLANYNSPEEQRSSSFSSDGITYQITDSENSGYFSYNFPKESGTIPLSVNGVFADEFGNVTIPTGGSVELGSGLHEGTDGKTNIGLDLATLGTTNKGLLTEDLYLLKVINEGNQGLMVLDNVVDVLFRTDSDNHSHFTTGSGYMSMNRVVNGEGQEIIFRSSTFNSNIVVVDSVNNKGIEYDGDYSANFTDHSLVTKKYVDDNTGGTTPTLEEVLTAGSFAEHTGRTSIWNYYPGSTTKYSQIDMQGDSLTLLQFNAAGEGQSISMSDSQIAKGIGISDEITSVGLMYGGDYSVEGKNHDRWVPDWKTVKNYVAENSVDSLQSVTTGAGNNITSNALFVTGAENIPTPLPSSGSVLSGLSLSFINEGTVRGFCSYSESSPTEWNLTVGAVSSLLKFMPQSAVDAGAEFTTRVSGKPAIQLDEFVTKAQLDKSIIVEIDNTTINLSKADLNTDFPLATYPIGTQVFCPEISTKYTRVYDDIWVSELFSEVL